MKKIFTTNTNLMHSAATRFGESYWTISSEKEISMAGEQQLFPNEYILGKLDVASFKLFQHQIPTESAGTFPIIELPAPDGSLKQYYIFEASMMSEQLAAHFPMIKTYTLIDLNDATVTGKADFTVWGFHAKIFDGANTYFIDPYRQGNQEWYLVFYKKDYSKPLNNRMSCLVDEDHLASDDLHDGGISLGNEIPAMEGQKKTFGTERRLYRLALACTEEYSAAVGGSSPSKASVFSAMTTTMNRVNGVFEREFSMTTQFVTNNQDLIYLPGSNDPYSNFSGGAMLGQNQATVGSIIGSANYDFGHVFSTGGGGIASFACVCRPNKAQGVTGSASPVGDPFDVDYVAHEMGHQFGGSHTFNSAIGSCGGNGSSSSAYEPGSGTTIMGYAGLCGSDNVQNNSDDYYHTRSLLQMTAHMEGNGNCAAKTNTNNTPPSLNAINQTYNIPYKTFFELEATASDPDGDPITYCWEQWDLGSSGPWTSTGGDNPIFRSFSPSTVSVRTFPEYKNLRPEIISVRGQVLPEDSRNMSFKAAVRDMNNGFGAYNFDNDELEVNAINTGSTLFRVTNWNTGLPSWTGDMPQTITWDPAGTQSGSVNTPTVDIYLSLDTGRTFPLLIASNTPNDGTESVIVPNFATERGIIKVKGHNNIFFDVNNTFITIVPQVYPTAINNIDKHVVSFYPNPAQDKLYLSNLNSDVKSISILNTHGQVVDRQVVNPIINIQHLQNGLYFIKFNYNSHSSQVEKLMIQR